jgi:hypothetical protein
MSLLLMMAFLADDSIFDDVDIVLFAFSALQFFSRRSKIPPIIPPGSFSLNRLPQDPLELFRFTVPQIARLVEALGLPATFTTGRKRYRVSGTEGLCILLRKLAFPARWNDTVALFHRSRGSLSEIFNVVLGFLFERWRHLFHSFPNNQYSDSHFRDIMRAFSQFGLPLANLLGFIDGTIRPVARPSWFQMLFYNGKDKVHALKYLALVGADGIVWLLYGPFMGPDHDARLQALSDLEARLRELGQRLNVDLYAYGDSAFSLSDVILKGHLGAALNAQQTAFNQSMSRGRIAVEHGFALPANLFWSLDLLRQNKYYSQNVVSIYFVAHLFANLYTCLNGNQTSMRNRLDPPPLSAYLRI